MSSFLCAIQQVEVRITAPLQWSARPGERAGFHLRVDNDVSGDSTENLEVRIPSEEVLEALASIRRAHSGISSDSYQEFRDRRVPRRWGNDDNYHSSHEL